MTRPASAPIEKGREARLKVGRVAATWMALALTSVGTLGALVIWHLVRRGRLIRARLDPPRPVRLPEIEVKGATRTADPARDGGP